MPTSTSRLTAALRTRRSAWILAALLALSLAVAGLVAPSGGSGGDAGGDGESRDSGDPDGSGDSGGSDGADDAAADAADQRFLMDPQVVETADGTWAIGSAIDGVTMPLMAVGEDGAATPTGAALRRAPDWAGEGFVGPSVVADGDTWWLLFAAQAADTGRYCLGAARTTDVAEGFEPVDEPLRCTDDRDLVDPSPYRGPDGLVVTWAQRQAAATADGADGWRIQAAPLELGDEPALGEVSELLVGEPGGWEAGIVDAPALVEVDGTLVLLYGGNAWGSEGYAAGYAVCPSPTERCERRSVDAPLEVPVAGEAAAVLTAPASLQPVAGEGAVGDDGSVEVAGFGLAFTTEGEALPVAVRAALTWSDGGLQAGPAAPIPVAAG
ncbi:MAG TPA: hypothetical protein VIL48_12380 [Acidimicrobiales bacterium]